jgi:hypothetical protein
MLCAEGGVPGPQGMQPPQQAGSGRFVQPLAQCDMVVTNIIQELQRDSWPARAACRPTRCTGMSTCLFHARWPHCAGSLPRG